MMGAAEILALIKLITDLEPAAIQAIQALVDKMSGLTAEQIAALTQTLNNTAISEIDAELGKLPPAKP